MPSLLSAIRWSIALILISYLLAQSLNFAGTWLSRTGYFLIIFFSLLIVIYILKIFFVKKGKRFFYFLSSVWKSVWQAVIDNKEVRKFKERHKKFFRFMQKRLDKNYFSGLPLTILSLALLYAVFLFGGVIEGVIKSSIIVSADIRVANLLLIFRDTAITKFFLWVTLLGAAKIIIVFTAAAVLILWILKKQVYIAPFLLSIAGSEFFTLVSKVFLKRPRPDIAVYAENSYSFPSGHATIAIAFYGFIAYMLIRGSKQWKTKINIFFAGLAIILLIGFSRLYLGVHYVSDVWGGYLVGAIWLIIGIIISEYFSYKKKAEAADLTAKKRLLIALLVVVSLGGYLLLALKHQPEIITAEKSKKQVRVAGPENIFADDKLKFTETLLGNKQEPLSFIILAKNDQNLIDLFKRSGWLIADEVNIVTLANTAMAALKKNPYPNAPMTPDFWNSTAHNFGFEKATGSNNARERHHSRFWKTDYSAEGGDKIYVGTASFDSGIKWGVTHKINPDIDTEREFLFNDLSASGDIDNFQKNQFVAPVLGQNFSGDQFFTDGKIYVIRLKK